jgi:hypothetical protein
MRSRLAIGAFAFLLAAELSAQGPPVASAVSPPPGPPVRVIGPATAATTHPVQSLTQARGISGGRVLINDGTARQLLLLDSTMTVIKIIADSTPGVENAYGIRAGRLVPYVADSSYLIDGASYSMLVIDERGEIVGVKAIPRADHAGHIAASAVYTGIPGFDSMGRLVYKLPDPIRYVTTNASGGILIPEQPDSAPLLRMDLKLRKLDSAAHLKIQKRITNAVRSASGMISSRTVTNPMPVVDDWGVMRDGSIAVLRSSDYHIDFIDVDGGITSGAPMPFDWQRLTDDHKRAFVDSLRDVLLAEQYSMVVRYDSINKTCFDFDPPARVVPRGYTPPRPLAVPPSVASSTPPAAATPSCPSGPLDTEAMFPPIVTIPPDSLPDYKPPFGGNSVRTDLDNNVWIRANQMRPIPGAIIYEVANRKGELIDRLQLPPGRTLIGFGPGGIVFLSVRDAAGQRILERVRWVKDGT